MEKETFTPEQIKQREDFKKISLIADKVIILAKEYGLPQREKFNIMMDFDVVNKICPLKLDRYLEEEHEESLLHDYAGIYRNLDRVNLKLKDYYIPRLAYNEKELCIYDTVNSFFNQKKQHFSKNECLVFAEEVAYEDFTCKVNDNEIIFENPNVPEENVSWKFSNIPSGRRDFVKDLLNTHNDLHHHNNNDVVLKLVLEKLNKEISVKKNKDKDYGREI